MIAQGFRVHAFEVDRYWADIGTVERYHLGHMALLDDPGLLPAKLRPATLERAAPLQTDGTNLRASQSTVAGVARHTFCYTGSVIEKGGTVTRSVLMPGARVRPGLHVQDSIVLENEVLSRDRIGLVPLELRQARSSRSRR
jgi:ADP-glucose pyrophosphorylase